MCVCVCVCVCVCLCVFVCVCVCLCVCYVVFSEHFEGTGGCSGLEIGLEKGLLSWLMFNVTFWFSGGFFWFSYTWVAVCSYLVDDWIFRFYIWIFIAGPVFWGLCQQWKSVDSIFKSGVCFNILVNKWIWECLATYIR